MNDLGYTVRCTAETREDLARILAESVSDMVDELSTRVEALEGYISHRGLAEDFAQWDSHTTLEPQRTA